MEDEGHGQEILHGQRKTGARGKDLRQKVNVGIRACKESGISDGSYYHWKVKFSNNNEAADPC